MLMRTVLKKIKVSFKPLAGVYANMMAHHVANYDSRNR